MMKVIYIILFVSIFSNRLYGQLLDELKPSSMPASTILGAQINDVTKPKRLDSLQISLMNNFFTEKGEFVIPKNYGLEFSPFLLSNKSKNYDYLDYISNKNGIYSNLTFSLSATSEFKILDTISSNALGFGIRTILYNGKASETAIKDYKEDLKRLAKYEEALGFINKNLIDYKSENTDEVSIKGFIDYLSGDKDFESVSFLFDILESDENININEAIKKADNPDDYDHFDQKFLGYFDAIYLESIKDVRSSIEAIDTRYGLRIDANMATALNFPTNDFSFSYLSKFSVWSNISWKPYLKHKNSSKSAAPAKFDVVGLVRGTLNNENFFRYHETQDSIKNLPLQSLDLGFRFIYDFDRLSISAEYLFRTNWIYEYGFDSQGRQYRLTSPRTVNDEKLVFSLSYNIKDNYVLSYNIGKGFDGQANFSGNLISGLSLNIGIGGLSKNEMFERAKSNLE